MKDDFVYRYKQKFEGRAIPQTNDDAIWDIDMIATNSLVCALEQSFLDRGKSLKDFDKGKAMDDAMFPLPDFEREKFYREIMDGTADKRHAQEKAQHLFEANLDALKQNECQWRAFETITGLINMKKGGLAFLEAPGGTGKTFLMNTLIYWIVMQGLRVASTASTGIAATLLHDGKTTHKQFKMPIPISTESLCHIGLGSDLAAYLRDVDLVFIIIDEGPMLDKRNFECIDRSLREITGKHDEVFGGKLVLVAGDWCQLLPIVPNGHRARVVGTTLKKSRLWNDDVRVFRLTENMRVLNEMRKHPHDIELHEELQNYEQWLIQLGQGTLPSIGGDKYRGQDIVEIPEQMVCNTSEEVIQAVYGDIEKNAGNEDYFKSRLIMAADNEIVNATNENLLDRLPGDRHVFTSIDVAQGEEGGGVFPEEYLNSLELSGMAQHELSLKVGAVVILLKNFNIKAGHCNGTRYIIKTIGKYRLILQKLTCDEDDENKILSLPRIPMTSTQSNLPFTLKRTQFPIKLAFTVTFNRAQSQTVPGDCGMLLPKSVWTHGQIYVGFSRCGNPRNIHVWADQDEFEDFPTVEGKSYVANIVYKEVLTTEDEMKESSLRHM